MVGNTLTACTVIFISRQIINTDCLTDLCFWSTIDRYLISLNKTMYKLPSYYQSVAILDGDFRSKSYHTNTKNMHGNRLLVLFDFLNQG